MWATTALACAAKVGQLVVGGVCEEIEKLEFDPIIITPDNPSRLHLLQILRILRQVLGKILMIWRPSIWAKKVFVLICNFL